MVSFSRAVERLYHTPMVGRAFSTLGSLLRVVQWRVEHANRIAEQSRVIAEQAGATASREAALGARIDELTRSLEVQAAVTSAVQRMARDEFEKTRDASKAAVAAREELESSLADLLNAATLNEVNTKSLREELHALREASAVEQAAIRTQVAGLEERLVRQVSALDNRVAENASLLDRRIGDRVSGVEQEARRVEADVGQHVRRVEGALENQARALESLRGQIGGLREEVSKAMERVEQAHAIGTSARNELWKRAGALEGELSKRAHQVDELNVRLNAFALQVNSLELGTQLASLRSAVEYLTSRVEFVRRETLLEARYGAPQSSGATEPRIVNAAKVRSMSRALRINVGCGHIAPPEYVNVDARELPGVDVVAEAGHMPFAPGSVQELHSAHLLEHFPQERLRREILPYFRSLLKKGGTLRAVVPDAEAMIREYAEGRYSYAELREVTFGGQDYDGDFHFNMFTPESLSALLREAGFSKVDVPVKARRNGACYEFEVVAT